MDGGGQGYDLPDLLEERKVKKLRAAICTSASEERFGGIIELMEAGFAITEYWIPEEILKTIEAASRFNEDWTEWAALIGKTPNSTPLTLQSPKDDSAPRTFSSAATLAKLALEFLPAKPNTKSFEQGLGDELTPNTGCLDRYFEHILYILTNRARSIRKISSLAGGTFKLLRNHLAQDETLESAVLLCGRLIMEEAKQLPGGTERGHKAVMQGLALAIMAAALLSRRTIKTRSFRHTGRRESYLIPRHPIMCLNGVEVDPRQELPKKVAPATIYQLARDLSAHKNSLVFQYGDIGCSALFCSDSRMMFLERNEKLNLDRPTIITAPRQGTTSGERAFAHITSVAPDNDIWVRSHYSNARKVSVYYKQQPNKICLSNCRDLTLQEILLNFDNNKWRIRAGGTCVCS